MGRIVDLCSEIAESAEAGGEGLVLPPDVQARLRADWTDEDIDDALTLVHENLLHSELVDLADSLSARLLELLGSYGEAAAFHKVETGQAVLTVDVLGQIARRVARLEEVLESYHDRPAPNRRGFDALQRRLADHGIEDDMERSRLDDGDEPAGDHAHELDDADDADDER
jgi:antitoxin component HigA of HigAB toxin-antitoxin module